MKKTFLPALAWLVVITVLSTMPGVQLPKFELFATDKLGHAFVYAVLVWLLLRGLARSESFPKIGVREGLLAFAFAAGYGALMEWVQGTFFPSRFFEWDDMIANAFGAAVALAIFLIFNRPRT